MPKRRDRPIVLTVAGSDSGGGAGIQADLKTFAALGVHGTCAITCVTAQNPGLIRDLQPCPTRMVRAQIAAVRQGLAPQAIKIGMLCSAAIIAAVREELVYLPRVPVVVDPVMISTSGRLLLAGNALQSLQRLLHLATLVTPNLTEAAALLGREVSSLDAMRDAAAELQSQYGHAVLIKGGHLRGTDTATDVFYDGQRFLMLRAPFVRGVVTHGTGCTYSAAIAAFLARGEVLTVAVKRAKRFITQAIASSYRAGKHTALCQGG